MSFVLLQLPLLASCEIASHGLLLCNRLRRNVRAKGIGLVRRKVAVVATCRLTTMPDVERALIAPPGTRIATALLPLAITMIRAIGIGPRLAGVQSKSIPRLGVAIQRSRTMRVRRGVLMSRTRTWTGIPGRTSGLFRPVAGRDRRAAIMTTVAVGATTDS